MFAVHWGKEPGLYHRMQPREWVTGSFLSYNKADWMDNSSDSIDSSFCCGGFHRDEWYSPSNSPCHLAVFLFNFSLLLLFSFIISYCWCFEPPSLPSSQLDIKSLASELGSYTPCLRCHLSHLWAQCHFSL